MSTQEIASPFDTPDEPTRIARRRRIDGLCDRFEAEWRSRLSPRLEEFLAEVPAQERGEGLRELLVVELACRTDLGERPTADEYRSRFPDDAATVVLAFGVDQSTVGERPGISAPTDDRPLGLPDIPGYVIERKLGAGGMGVVYLARQPALNRSVALKILRGGALADDAEKARFQREAQASAGLDHRGIVAVHEVGEHQGLAYFSMAFIEGSNLAERVAEGPLPPREATELARGAAEAVHYAHERGIIHRDLKPANILIDSSGLPRITDFGLAKRLRSEEAKGGGGEEGTRPAAVPQDLTVTGQILGTPNYMPPEQARGLVDQIGRAADVYALGATLYHLLVGRPPFQSADPWDTVRQVVETDPVSPRRLNPSLPKDLETIVLKCLEKEPSRRYSTAQDVAGELARFERDEPIRARPLGRFARTWRWCRRRPAAAGLIATLATSLVAIAAGAGVWALRERTLRAEAQRNFDRAESAVQNYVEAVNDDEVLADERWQPTRRRLLADAREYYKEFIAEHQDDPESLPRLAWAMARLGEISHQTGDHEQAIASLTEATGTFEQLCRQAPDDVGLQRSLAKCYLNLAVIQAATGRHAEALKTHTAEIDLLRRLVDRLPLAADLKTQLGMSYANLARLQGKLGKSSESFETFERALMTQRAMTRGDPSATGPQGDLAHTLNSLAAAQYVSGDRESAAASYSESLAIQEAMADRPVAGTESRRDLAQTLNNFAQLKLEAGQSRQAMDLHGRALSLRETLARDNPHRSQFQSELAESHGNFGNAIESIGDGRGAIESYRKSIEILGGLVDSNPSVTDFQHHLSLALLTLATVESRLGRYDDALESAGRSLEVAETLAREHPSVTDHLDQVAVIHNRLGAVHRETGNLIRAMESFRQAHAAASRVQAQQPTLESARQHLVDALSNLGVCEMESGRPAQARDFYRQALEHQIALVAAQPSSATLRASLVAIRVNLANAYVQLGELSAARENYEQARDAQRRLVEDVPTPEQSSTLAVVSANLGLLQSRLADDAASAESFREAVERQRAALGAALDVAAFRTRLRNYSANLAARELALDRLPEAVAATIERGEHSAGEPDELFATTIGFAECLAVYSSSAAAWERSAGPIDRERIVGLAVETLREAIAAGFNDFERIKTEPLLDPLRGEAAFQSIVEGDPTDR